MPQPSMNPATSGLMAERLQLEWPASVGVFDRYDQAQKAVDHLADNAFPVQHVMIVGTDLRQVERVTGRLSQQKVALGGLASGMWMGLFVGLIFSMFDQQGFRSIVTTVLFGALFGLVWALIGYSLTRGRRDFTSVSQVVATRYEVLVERQLQAQAREMLRGAGLLGAHAAAASGPGVSRGSTSDGGMTTTGAGAPTAPPTGRPYDLPAPGDAGRPRDTAAPTDGSHGEPVRQGDQPVVGSDPTQQLPTAGTDRGWDDRDPRGGATRA